jgi:alanine dehydrogenase
MALLLSQKDVQAVLTMEECLPAVESAFAELARGKAVMPQRTVIKVTEHKGLFLGMPAYIGGDLNALGLKAVTVYPDNPARHGLPTTLGTLLLCDPTSGQVIAIMDAGYLTAVRTGAASGVATRYLAREEAGSCLVFGAGVQARQQLVAMNLVRALKRVQVIDIDEQAAARFAGEMSQALGVEVTVATEVERAVAAADLIVTASSSQTPLFSGDWLQAGTHINNIGSHSPPARELDTRTVVRAKFVADLKEACLAEAGDILIPIQEGAVTPEHIYASLGELVAGMRPGRQTNDEITVFKSCGLAVQDMATAVAVYKAARERGIGTEVQM